jgi:hypothetical protein
MVEGYHHYERWDIRGTIRTAIRRCAFYLTKGVEEKENIIQSTDRLLVLINAGRWYGQGRRGGKRPKEPSRTEHEPT